MAKSTGPLLSLGASGTLAKTMVFSKWKGRAYVRRHVIPSNPKTSEQLLTRNVFSFGSGIWKAAPTLLRAPWDRFAVGQVLTGRNAFIGKNTRELRTAALMTGWIGSPGAKGGLAPEGIVLTPTSGGLDVAFTVPAPPTGWTLQASVAAVILDQDPQSPSTTLTVVVEEAMTPWAISLTGLIGTADMVVSAWLRWAKPDGSIAYGASINATDAPLA